MASAKPSRPREKLSVAFIKATRGSRMAAAEMGGLQPPALSSHRAGDESLERFREGGLPGYSFEVRWGGEAVSAKLASSPPRELLFK